MTAAAGSVIERLGVRIDGDAAGLLGLALRRNPRRAQLLVSRVLGKHIPTDPRVVSAAGMLLGSMVADALRGRPPRTLELEWLHSALRGDAGVTTKLYLAGVNEASARTSDPPDALVLGFAETATALGHCVAAGLGGVDYLHSTRRPVPGHAPVVGFTEEHSHATEHLLLPADPAILRGDRPLVVVDDELSTGRTALDSIAALHAIAPREHYVVAALVDVRPPGTDLAEQVRALGARLDVVALARGSVRLPADLAERAAGLRADVDTRPGRSNRGDGPGPDVRRVELAGLGWPSGLAVGGRHGFRTADHAGLNGGLNRVVGGLGVQGGDRTLVLGTEELMALPLQIAVVLRLCGYDVSFSTTTRSPAVVVDEPDYALRTGITFPAHDDPADGPGPRYAYNIGDGWDHVLVVVDPPADTPVLYSGLVAALEPHTRRTTVVVTP